MIVRGSSPHHFGGIRSRGAKCNYVPVIAEGIGRGFAWCLVLMTRISGPFLFFFGSSLIGLVIGSLILGRSWRVLAISMSFHWSMHSSISFFRTLQSAVSGHGYLLNSQYLDLSGGLYGKLWVSLGFSVLDSTSRRLYRLSSL